MVARRRQIGRPSCCDMFAHLPSPPECSSESHAAFPLAVFFPCIILCPLAAAPHTIPVFIYFRRLGWQCMSFLPYSLDTRLATPFSVEVGGCHPCNTQSPLLDSLSNCCCKVCVLSQGGLEVDPPPSLPQGREWEARGRSHSLPKSTGKTLRIV